MLFSNSLCQVRSIDNLQEFHWVHPYNQTLGYGSNQDFRHDLGLFERGFEGRMSLFTATNDDSSKRTPNSVPYLSGKVLQKEGDRYSFQYTFQNDTMSSVLTMKGKSSVGYYLIFPYLYLIRAFLTSMRFYKVLIPYMQAWGSGKIVPFRLTIF